MLKRSPLGSLFRGTTARRTLGYALLGCVAMPCEPPVLPERNCQPLCLKGMARASLAGHDRVFTRPLRAVRPARMAYSGILSP
jgi:hypothetical protein